MVVREPRDEVEDVGPFALLSINFEGGLAEVGIGAGQVNRRSTATVRVDRRVPRDAEKPRLDPAITPAEPAQARECPLERIGREVERVGVAPGPRTQVAVHRKAMLLVQQPERGRIQPLPVDLAARHPFLDHDGDSPRHVPSRLSSVGHLQLLPGTTCRMA